MPFFQSHRKKSVRRNSLVRRAEFHNRPSRWRQEDPNDFIPTFQLSTKVGTKGRSWSPVRKQSGEPLSPSTFAGNPSRWLLGQLPPGGRLDANSNFNRARMPSKTSSKKTIMDKIWSTRSGGSSWLGRKKDINDPIPSISYSISYTETRESAMTEDKSSEPRDSGFELDPREYVGDFLPSVESSSGLFRPVTNGKQIPNSEIELIAMISKDGQKFTRILSRKNGIYDSNLTMIPKMQTAAVSQEICKGPSIAFFRRKKPSSKKRTKKAMRIPRLSSFTKPKVHEKDTKNWAMSAEHGALKGSVGDGTQIEDSGPSSGQSERKEITSAKDSSQESKLVKPPMDDGEGVELIALHTKEGKNATGILIKDAMSSKTNGSLRFSSEYCDKIVPQDTENVLRPRRKKTWESVRKKALEKKVKERGRKSKKADVKKTQEKLSLPSIKETEPVNHPLLLITEETNDTEMQSILSLPEFPREVNEGR